MKTFYDILIDVRNGNFVRNLDGTRVETLQKLLDENRQHLLYVFANKYASRGNLDHFRNSAEYTEIKEVFADLGLGTFEWYFLPVGHRTQYNSMHQQWTLPAEREALFASLPSLYSRKTALHFAVENRSSTLVLEWLIQFGVLTDGIYQARTLIETPLDMAIRLENEPAIKTLIDRGAILGPIRFPEHAPPYTHPSRFAVAVQSYVQGIISAFTLARLLLDNRFELNGYQCDENTHEPPILFLALSTIAKKLDQDAERMRGHIKVKLDEEASHQVEVKTKLKENSDESTPKPTPLTRAILTSPLLNFAAVVRIAKEESKALLEILLEPSDLPLRNFRNLVPGDYQFIQKAFRQHVKYRFLLVNQYLEANVAQFVSQYELNPNDYANYDKARGEARLCVAKNNLDNLRAAAQSVSSSSVAAVVAAPVVEAAAAAVEPAAVAMEPAAAADVSPTNAKDDIDSKHLADRSGLALSRPFTRLPINKLTLEGLALELELITFQHLLPRDVASTINLSSSSSREVASQGSDCMQFVKGAIEEVTKANAKTLLESIKKALDSENPGELYNPTFLCLSDMRNLFRTSNVRGIQHASTTSTNTSSLSSHAVGRPHVSNGDSSSSSNTSTVSRISPS